MHKATERVRFDVWTETVVVECTTPDGDTFDIQINSDAAEAVVQAFKDAKLEPPLGLEDSGVYDVRDVKLIAASNSLLLDFWVLDGRKARFVLQASTASRDLFNALSKELRRLLARSQLTHFRH